MSFNGCTKKNCPEKWCAFELIVRHGIIDSPYPHALTIYFKFVPACGAVPERFEKCQCEDNDVRLHCQTWVPSDGHYHWLQGPINSLSMEHRIEYLTRTIHRILGFL
jgi:hypothetical protein